MEVDGVSLTMGGAAVSAIAGVVGAWIKAKYGKPVVPPVPQPLETERVGPYVTCGECKQHRAAIGKRIDTIETLTRTIINKLDEIDTRAEQRSENLHRRLDPLGLRPNQTSPAPPLTRCPTTARTNQSVPNRLAPTR